MNTDSGEIRKFAPGEKVLSQFTELTYEEHSHIEHFPAQDRPLELATFRFRKQREELGGKADTLILNAFRQGYLAGVKDQKP